MVWTSLSPQDLIQGCARTRDAGAWEEFIRRFHRLIAGVVLRTAQRWAERSPAAIDDLVQEVDLKLCADDCRLLTSFESEHPDAIYGYLKVITANLVQDHFKALHAQKRGSGHAFENLDAVDPPGTLGSEREIEREILLQQIDAVLAAPEAGTTQERDRTIFWLYYRQGFTANAIAALPSIGLTSKGVESTLLRLTRLVRDELRGEQGIQAANSF
jgi:RNA polymerase sigma-70 factor (ECF subfamily)